MAHHLNSSKFEKNGWYFIRTHSQPFEWQPAKWNGKAFWIGGQPYGFNAIYEVCPDKITPPSKDAAKAASEGVK